MKPTNNPQHPAASFSIGFKSAGYLIGFSLGGFFDGILLHQVLQWHHLLSLVERPGAQDLRFQILADGMFHILMYLIAVAGLACLWKSRKEFSNEHAGRWLAGAALIGFGIWNVIDVGFFHWILGLHRTRVDVPNPLIWDLVWLLVFGISFLIVGGLICRKAINAQRDAGSRGTALASLISVVVIVAGLVSALPPAGDGATLVVFRASTTPQDVFQAFQAVDARVVWADGSGTIWAVRMMDGTPGLALYKHGAMLVSNSAFALGCLSWIKV